MASGNPGPCCTTGFKHEGTPEGETKLVGDIPTYFAYPKNSKSPEKAIIFMSDAFGQGLVNNKLLADDFANNGYLTVFPDIFAGDPLPLEDFEAGKIDIMPWLAKHSIETVEPVINSIIKHVKEDLGVKRIGAVGYCFGGKYVIRYLKHGKLDSGYIAHPSLVTKEELAAIEKPLSIAAAEIDTTFTTELRHDSEAILIKTGQPYQINLFSGVSHGFAARADLSKPHDKFAKESAFLQAVSWFNYTL